MRRERLVLDTSEDRKAALVERLALQGESFSDWIDDQIQSAIGVTPPDAVGLREPQCVSDVVAGDVLDGLAQADWAFTSADTRYLTHDLHPYPAKFPPQIPAQLIQSLSLPGDLVFDPFGGSATTAVEAVRLRRRALSFDANPLSTLLGRTKTAFLDEEAFRQLSGLAGVVGGYIGNAATANAEWANELATAHASFIPAIPNLEKWFAPEAIGELALLRHLITTLTMGTAQDAALVAFSRIITRVSNQDSETRYVAVQKCIGRGLVLRSFAESLKAVNKKLEQVRSLMRGASAEFVAGDARTDIADKVAPASVDLIVSSPPYPNATDYHLYHRFRLFWLGWDPRSLGAIEIGSHLKHQRNGTDFAEYEQDMTRVLDNCITVLQPGRHAVFIVGDAVFKGEQFSTSVALADAAKGCGFDVVGTVSRPIHETRRSFAKPARRARSEELLILQRPNMPITIAVAPPRYRMWPFESRLRLSEMAGLGLEVEEGTDPAAYLEFDAAQPALWNVRRAAFSTASMAKGAGRPQAVWQKILENGDATSATRKDPKYATHGIHPYKGKFYPQLAKSLLNSTGIECGARVLDPYCGSGTVPLECLLNGYSAVGVDLNPLAAKIARAKTGILLLDHDIVEAAAASLAATPIEVPATSLDQFPEHTHAELLSWFPQPVLSKLNLLLDRVRLLGDKTLIDFFEVVLSSIVREVSQQEPTDLRIRRRKESLNDAPVVELFRDRLELQMRRLRKYWAIEARQPGARLAPLIIEGDSRSANLLDGAGIEAGSVDCVVTSPPYATALPYIDTDRLSILALLGITSSDRNRVEEKLTGSREIRRKEREALENRIASSDCDLPRPVVDALTRILIGNRAEGVGFRRQNMAALLFRYFDDVRSTLQQVRRTLKTGGRAYYVVGDSRTQVGDEWVVIETCNHINQIASELGFAVRDPIGIDVTTERMLHMKNAITTNEILVFDNV